MPYATLDDLIERGSEDEIRQIADRDRDGIPDPEVIEAALQDADNQVNGYVGAKYALPLPSVPDLVRSWAISIARYTLHHNGAPKHVKDDRDDALSALKEVAGGLQVLPVAPGDPEPVSTGGTVMAEHPATVFTPEKLRGWK